MCSSSADVLRGYFSHLYTNYAQFYKNLFTWNPIHFSHSLTEPGTHITHTLKGRWKRSLRTNVGPFNGNCSLSKHEWRIILHFCLTIFIYIMCIELFNLIYHTVVTWASISYILGSILKFVMIWPKNRNFNSLKN